ncbi:MAG: putative malate transporter [Bacillota bacterium]|nr:putative malate transporter [Bacillota bacterium]
MDNLIFSINVVLPMFLIMCLGTFFKKINIFDEIFLKKANTFTFKALLPVLLFNNIYKSKITDIFNGKLVIFAVSIVLILIAFLMITVPKFEKDNKNRGVLIQGMFRSNFVLFGIPLVTNISGSEGGALSAMLIAIIIPLYNFTSVIILDIYSKENLQIKETLIGIAKNPLIIGSFLGILTSIFKLNLPNSIEKTISDVASLATPLALMTLGGEFEIGNVLKNKKYITIVCAFKLLISPAIILPIAIFIGFRGPELASLFAMAAAPIAVTSFTMAQNCGSNYELAGQIVFISTILSSFTIFMFTYIFKTMGVF